MVDPWVSFTTSPPVSHLAQRSVVTFTTMTSKNDLAKATETMSKLNYSMEEVAIWVFLLISHSAILSSITHSVVFLETENSDDVISVKSVEELNPPSLSREICICCGELEIHTQHPLFHGGICAPCTETLLERFFLCDEDGSQADCTICCWGNSLMMCDDPKCHRCFCEECVETLVCPGHSEEIKDTNPWNCFLCVPNNRYGLLRKKTKWREYLKHFYDQESNSLQIYQPLSPWERKPIHVLSLFDNITKELNRFGFLEKNMGNGRLKYLDDVKNVTRTHIEEWGPFDFIFGSTPPVSMSYQDPPAWYFYQYMRILQYGRPPEGSQKPFFWLFLDNLVLDEEDRDTASRFFQASRKNVGEVNVKIFLCCLLTYINLIQLFRGTVYRCTKIPIKTM
ncbi:DNA (cytosine-5)-methyltransferase 3-like isoform X1 [Anolis carolinensis]|uniref:DNA (cytosine-5)-methyltransferase 3-like isoform X1 n=1 Tax=Anolis carolinensis TaxID=28377 RepID=UPI002F2B3328